MMGELNRRFDMVKETLSKIKDRSRIFFSETWCIPTILRRLRQRIRS